MRGKIKFTARIEIKIGRVNETVGRDGVGTFMYGETYSYNHLRPKIADSGCEFAK